ncbi:pyridoxamine 5'-phosphate oxidase family protein [Puniceibacterium sediminis]|uniref:Pyridoxamine 5'-phosphate oxidase n=1 Tax=Puniceibacterium sediminis TaxID=1608407 RepID=A0A238XPS8_9RHOB|nr:pyridoxamine 5'-phosphate oxidase family protein [Puniceibacterium sediminis]SNR60344.1 Pyridoxamine 5'-phosphate oxidase [Puniceibacterium sediminis]
MAKQFDRISPEHRAFIEAQHIFFTGTAGPSGRVNVSPKGMESLRVTEDNRILWLNLTGSGNETAGHLTQDPRMTLMWCSFTRRPMILRAYGTARTLHRDHPDWAETVALFGDPLGARQIYDLSVEMVQSSCGYSIPFFDHVGERDTLKVWAEDKGEDGIETYWDTRNRTTIDGAPTGIEANLNK